MPNKSKKPSNQCAAFILTFLVVLGVVWLAANYSSVKSVSSYSVSTRGPFFVPSNELQKQNLLKIDGTTITIGLDCLAIVADTSQERADAIALSLANKTGDRPNAWDGWASSLSTFNITFEAVTLYGKTSSAYLSQAVFRRDSDVLELDMRPSDAIALALRTNTPIYINTTLLKEDGKNVCGT